MTSSPTRSISRSTLSVATRMELDSAAALGFFAALRSSGFSPLLLFSALDCLRLFGDRGGNSVESARLRRGPLERQPFLRLQWLIDALDRHLGQMFDEFENLAQFLFSTRAGQLDGPAEIALAGIKLLQRWQLLSVQLANTHRPQSSQVAQQHDRIGAAREHLPVRPEFNPIKIQFPGDDPVVQSLFWRGLRVVPPARRRRFLRRRAGLRSSSRSAPPVAGRHPAYRRPRRHRAWRAARRRIATAG